MPESLVRVKKLTGKTLIFHNVDLCDLNSLRQVMEKYSIDCVIHFAALKAVGESCVSPLKYYKNNVIVSYNLIEVLGILHVL